MRMLALLGIMASIGLPALASHDAAREAVSVRQLEQFLALAHGKPYAKVAVQLYQLKLTERLGTATLKHLETELPGPKTQQALVALADASAFLNPPSEEIPAIAKPDATAQREIISLAAGFVVKSMHRLPDFFATRDTTEFQEKLEAPDDPASIAGLDSPLHFVGTASATVLYRDGQEVVNEAETTKSGKKQSTNGLNTVGVFGPLLGTVIKDVVQGTITWSHWEWGTAGALAVFHYSVPQEKSHWEVKHCCVWFPIGQAQLLRIPGLFDEFPSYHGEIAVDPASGTILRLVVQPELQPDFPIVRADVEVEYGLVEIGGRSYICPVRCVSISNSTVNRSKSLGPDTSASGFKMTALNDVVFRQYHLFRADVRILAGDNPEKDGNATAPSATPAKASQP
jgi:hypothetical protein